jgi:hypothetical protein
LGGQGGGGAQEAPTHLDVILVFVVRRSERLGMVTGTSTMTKHSSRTPGHGESSSVMSCHRRRTSRVITHRRTAYRRLRHRARWDGDCSPSTCTGGLHYPIRPAPRCPSHHRLGATGVRLAIGTRGRSRVWRPPLLLSPGRKTRRWIRPVLAVESSRWSWESSTSSETSTTAGPTFSC